MQTSELNTINTRLGVFAHSVGDTPPATLIGPQGEPSQDVLTFCKTHNLTLDWAFLGQGPQFRTPQKTLRDVEEDLTFLHALLQGLDALIDDCTSGSSPTSNAAYALSQEVVAKCDGILTDVGNLQRRAQQ